MTPLKAEEPDLLVTNSNKSEFIGSLCISLLTGRLMDSELSVRQYLHVVEEQMEAIRNGLHQFVPETVLAEFTPQGHSFTFIDRFVSLGTHFASRNRPVSWRR